MRHEWRNRFVPNREAHLTLNPTLRALSSMRRNGVRTMLMGGQACVYYGAAEFSRDLDLLVLADPANLLCLRGALAELETKVTPQALPDFAST